MENDAFEEYSEPMSEMAREIVEENSLVSKYDTNSLQKPSRSLNAEEADAMWDVVVFR